MKVTFAPRDILQIDDARIVYRNFSGIGSKFNREGDRNFSIVIPDEELRGKLPEYSWNVKSKPSRDEDEPPFMHLPVKIKFNDRGPACYLVSGDTCNRLDEETVGVIDDVDILSCSMDIRPYDWDVNGKTGRTAYLQSIEVIQKVDRFAAKYLSN